MANTGRNQGQDIDDLHARGASPGQTHSLLERWMMRGERVFVHENAVQ